MMASVKAMVDEKKGKGRAPALWAGPGSRRLRRPKPRVPRVFALRVTIPR